MGRAWSQRHTAPIENWSWRFGDDKVRAASMTASSNLHLLWHGEPHREVMHCELSSEKKDGGMWTQLCSCLLETEGV